MVSYEEDVRQPPERISLALLRGVMAVKRISQKELAAETGMTYTHLSALLKRDTVVARRHAQLLSGCDRLGIKREWIILAAPKPGEMPQAEVVLREAAVGEPTHDDPVRDPGGDGNSNPERRDGQRDAAIRPA
jgi:DNA-binding Xre family transcriptional regulator